MGYLPYKICICKSPMSIKTQLNVHILMKTKQDNPIQTQQVLKFINVELGGNTKGFSLKRSIQHENEIGLLCKQLSLLIS